MSTKVFQVIDSTGEVVGGLGTQPCSVTLYGWFFSNSGASAYEVDFYIPVAATGGKNPALPSASGTKVFTIQVPATTSKEFHADKGIYFPDGLFAKASNAAVTGGVVHS